MFNVNHASSYRRLFRIVTRDMQNWKERIIVCVDSDDMRGATHSERICRAVDRMGKIKRAVEFMVGSSVYDHVKIHTNAEGNGKTLVYRNAGYYKNIGA